MLTAILCAALLFIGTPSFAEGGMALNGDEFLARLANVFFRVRHGFSNNQIYEATHGDDCILLSYSSSVFLSIKETPPPREVINISVVLVTQGEDAGNAGQEKDSPDNHIVFEDICRQVIYAMSPAVKESGVQKMMKELGFGGENFDGLQRSLSFESCKYIVKYNGNGMLIMVVSGL